MSKLFVLLFLFFTFSAFSQISIPSNQKAKDLVYDPVTDKIYITIPASDVTNGNSIGVINPYTNILESTLLVGNDPVEMAISDNGQYIYVAFDGVAKVRRYTLNPLAFDMEFALGVYPPPANYGSYYARDIAVMPGQPDVIAVSRKVIANVSPDHAGIGIYENGVMRPVNYLSNSFIHVTKLKFKDSNTLIGHAGTSTSAGTTLFNVDDQGITLISDHPGIPNPHPYLSTSDFVYNQNKLYFMNGRRVDISSTPILNGQFGISLFDGGGVMYDEINDFVCFGHSSNTYSFYQNGFWDGYLKFYDATTLELIDSIQITTAGDIEKMCSCGVNCYAMINAPSENNLSRVVIVREQVLNTNDFSFDSNFSLYPNPTSDISYIKNNGKIDIKNIAVYNSFGKIILNQFNKYEINLGAFASGIYFCKITDIKGNIYTTKIVKK